MRLLINTLIFLLLSSLSAYSATYYVRPDGGRCQDITSSGFDTPGDTFFAKQCDGLTDHALVGATGTNCACNHPNWVVGNSGGVSALWSAGDTLIIKNNSDGSQASYEVGCLSSSPNSNCLDYRYGINNSGNCYPAYPYGCTMRNIPAGIDVNNKTKIYGESYSNCTETTVRPSLWGTQRLPYVIQTTNGNIDMQCLEITDHSACIYSGPIDTAVDGFPVQCVRTTAPTSGPWAHDGIELAGSPDNVSIHNVDVHGMGRYGIQIGTDSTTNTFGNLLFNGVRVIANAWGGIQSAPNYTSSSSKLVHITNSIIDWNGCGERYPLQSTLDSSSNAHHCSSQTQIASAADGIAFGNGGAGSDSNWWIDNSKIRWNTQDGFDVLHGVAGDNIYMKVTRSLFEGNAGNALKIVGKQNYLENNLIIGNCGFFHGQSFTSTTSNSTNSTDCNTVGGTWNAGTSTCEGVELDNCRAGGSPIVYNIGADFNNLFYNNTVLSNGTYILEGAHGTNCNAGTLNQTRNNIFYGGTQWLDDSVLNGGGNATVNFWLLGTDGGTCNSGSGFNTLDNDYDVIYNVSSYTNCTGAHSKCNQNPNFLGTIKQGSGSDASYYQGLDYADQLGIASNSAGKGFGVSGLSFQNGSTDYNNYPQNSPVDIGGLQYGSINTCIDNGNYCSNNSDCCSGTCSQNHICAVLGSYLYNITPTGSIKFQ